MTKIEYISITIKIKKKMNDLLDYFQENLNIDKEEYIAIIIERELISRVDDIQNFSFL